MSYTAIIPAYNASATLAEAIDSILNQTVPAKEIIVIDDGSIDGTARIAESYGGIVSVHSQPNRGPGAAMTSGMAMVATDFIAAIDADDVWLPQKMSKQLGFLAANPDCAGIFGHMQLFGERIVGDQFQESWGRSVMTIRREVFLGIGEVVDPPGMRGEMIDWIARAREAGFMMKMLPDVVAMRRVLRGSLSDRRDAEKDSGYLHVARAALLRRRAMQSRA